MLSGLMTLGLVCFGGIHQGSPGPAPITRGGWGSQSQLGREKIMTIKYFIKYREQFCASRGF